MSDGFTPSQLINRDINRLKGYKELLDFYHGRHWEGYARRGEKRLTFNYSKVVIDKITSYLMSGITFTVEAVEDSDEARARARRAEQALYQVYEDNNLEQLDFETEIDCAILGDACFKVIWDTETKRVRITAPDTQGIYAWWLGDDTSRLWKVASRYNLTSDEVEILYKVKPKGKTANVVELWTAHDFELWLDNAQVEKKPNPYGFIPFIIYPNLREPKKFWGISDLPQIMEPQQELNRAMSQLSRILELSGNPIAVLENVEVSSSEVTLTTREGQTRVIEADTIVLAAGAEPNRALYDQLKGRVAETYLVGDCIEPRSIRDAITDGFRIGHII